MREDIRRAFTNRPLVLPPKWLYDEVGSDLFEEITRLDEYYPTEAERSLLKARADEIATITGADTLIELGSGTSNKTRTLLDAFHRTGQLRRFVPLDVSEATLLDAANMLATLYPGLEVHALVGDFTRHLGHLPEGDCRLVAFLGSTVGNFYVEERHAFLGALADNLEPGEWLLLGVDLVKPIGRILDAYNDKAGLTGRFIKNVLTVLNRSLDADFDLDAFDFSPMWDGSEERVDMRLRATMPQRVRIDGLDLDVDLGEGEELRVEISTKFRPGRLAVELEEAGLMLNQFWTDDNGDFGMALARRV
ncbi:MAG: L-histidine N(alpha)-methyltransferase [Actinomycetia bacterium]|nr:L-histidine N(alpha)-methyltransferase [Actinomycetes bacterium]MCP4227610.1 L-histidine N(alpha)-methyltransferase [Actinomycetes bacterium]MCP5033401.1 L-histidine N(alpha)-methyltransferase [Actinomycetes bacterium]